MCFVYIYVVNYIEDESQDVVERVPQSLEYIKSIKK